MHIHELPDELDQTSSRDQRVLKSACCFSFHQTSVSHYDSWGRNMQWRGKFQVQVEQQPEQALVQLVPPRHQLPYSRQQVCKHRSSPHARGPCPAAVLLLNGAIIHLPWLLLQKNRRRSMISNSQ